MAAGQVIPPTVSVVICTRNRSDTILQAVASVLANVYPTFDLTIIDQSKDATTERILGPLMEGDPRLRYLHVDEPGLSRAYNTGIARTGGDLLAFTDDDCVVPRDWLTTIVNTFHEDPEADLLYGQVLPPDDTAMREGITPTLILRQQERLSQRDGFTICGMGANFAAQRRLFPQIGGFDEVLGGGAPLRSSQDFDLAYRAYLAGKVILLCPEVRVIHYGTRAPQDWPATLQAYGIGDGAFYFKHVRCRDLFALRLLVHRLLLQSTREFVRPMRGQGRGNWIYLRFIMVGIWKCLQFNVDRDARLYVSR